MLLLLCLDISGTIFAAENRMEGIQYLLYAALFQVESIVLVFEVCLYIRQATAFPVLNAVLVKRTRVVTSQLLSRMVLRSALKLQVC